MSAAPSPETNTPDAALLDALQRHRRAFRDEPFPDLATRRDRLQRLSDTLYARREAIGRAIASDFGHRSHHETLLADVTVSCIGIRHLIKHLPQWMEPEPRPVPLHFFPGSARIIPQPLGVVGVISPWNYPVQLAVVPLATALAAGNRVMIKPSELTPATTELLVELLGNLYDPDLVSVHPGGSDVGKAFAELHLDHILFTGSTQVGRIVMQAAAKNLTPVTLELGGKSPAVVGPGADLSRAASRIMAGKLFNAGQTCIAPDYALVPRAQVEPFVAAARASAQKLFPTFADNPDYTSIINERHHARIRHLLSDAVDKGARAISLAEGESFASGHKLAPTLLLDVTEEMAVMQEEIFGPLLPIVATDSLDDAIDYVNDHPRPLALYMFERDGAAIERVLHRTHAGGVTVNDTLLHIAQDDLPFGGVGPSGMGAYHGKEGFDTLSHRKSVFEQPRVNSGFLLDPPYGRKVERLASVILRFFPS